MHPGLARDPYQAALCLGAEVQKLALGLLPSLLPELVAAQSQRLAAAVAAAVAGRVQQELEPVESASA